MLNKCKVNMKRDLENSITNYNESVLTVHQVGIIVCCTVHCRTDPTWCKVFTLLLHKPVSRLQRRCSHDPVHRPFCVATGRSRAGMNGVVLGHKVTILVARDVHVMS